MPSDFHSLTSKQKKVYSAIEAFIKTRGIPPTVREIGELVGEKTPGAVQGILNRLEQKGVIKREMGMARSIKLVTEHSQYEDPVYLPELKKISRRNMDNLLNLYNIVKYQPIPSDIVSSGEKCFILSCPDIGLKGLGIGYEDKLVIERDPALKDGDIVLALYENHVLLRQYFFSGKEGMVKLKADSSHIDKETFNAEEVFVVGKLVGRFTKF